MTDRPVEPKSESGRVANRKPPRWYPIECEHGYDCCPICDGPRRDTITLKPTV